MKTTGLKAGRRLLGAVLFASALAVGGCGGGDSECDECGQDSDCDSGQSCIATTLGDRCVKDGESSCGVSLGQL